MASCPNCGAPAGGRFCAKCGADLGASANQPPGNAEGSPVTADITDNVAAAMCYLLLGITGLLFLVLEPYNHKRVIRYHAFQSIFFTVALAICWIVVITAGIILAYIPWIGGLIAGLLFLTLSLGGFLIWLMLMYKAYNGQAIRLPFVGDLAEKQA